MKTDQTNSDRSLNDKAYDLLGDMLLQRETDAMLQGTDGETASGAAQEADAFFAARDAKYLTLIRRHIRKRITASFFRHTLPKIGQAAAILITVLAVAGGVAIAASPALRLQVMRLLMQVEEDYTELRLVEDPAASSDVPADWLGENYVTYIPAGLELSAVHGYPGNNLVEYIDPADQTRRFNFSELSDSAVTNVDTENAVVRSVTIFGYDGTIAIKGEAIHLFWANGKTYFVINSENLDESAVIQIAEGVIRIN